MTMSQIPDVNRELAEVGAMFAVFEALRRKRLLLACTSNPLMSPLVALHDSVRNVPLSNRHTNGVLRIARPTPCRSAAP